MHARNQVKLRRVLWYGPTVMLLATTLLVMIAGPRLARKIAWAQNDSQILLVKDSLAKNPSLADLSKAFRQVAKVVEPSVVHIRVSTARRSHSSGRLDDDLLRRFFGPDRLPDRFRPDPDDESPDGEPDDLKQYDVPQAYGSGSGWVYDNDGHIITNYHVIDSADVITVRFHDGSEREAEIIGTDPKTDIAVIKIDGGELYPATLAKETVEQGDIVFAFGSPFRFEFSVSQGIVSAKGRRLGILENNQGYEDFIQTDAAINPGNSGGPLTNIYGRVVGMNTAIATRSGGNQGLGFAIPVDMVRNIVDQLIASGKVSRGYLGIYITSLDPKLARTFGYDGEGVLVENPIEDGPAIEAGVERGDIITHINDTPVTSADGLRNLVAAYPPGTELTISVFRDGETLDLTVTIAELPDQVSVAVTDPKGSGDTDSPGKQLLRKLGLTSVVGFTEEHAKQLEMPFEPGVLIKAVRANSAAAAAGITNRLVITDVMGVPVDSVTALSEQLAAHDLAKGVRVSVRDRVNRRFVLLELPE